MDRFLAIAVTVIAAVACTPAIRPLVSEADILRIAKDETFRTCQTGTSRGYRKVSCDYHAQLIDGTWSVLITPDYRNQQGERLVLTGAHSLRIYSGAGKLLRILPGK